MRIFFQELYKLCFNKKFITIFIVALLLNIGLFFVSNSSSHYNALEYQNVYHKVKAIDDEKKSEYIENHLQSILDNTLKKPTFTTTFEGELELFTDIKHQWNTIVAYPHFITTIEQRASDSKVAIFKKQSNFQKRDASKTIEDYQAMRNVNVSFTNVHAFQNAIDFVATDLITLALIFFIVVSLLIYEKEHNLFLLLKPTKEGRGGLIRAKILIILIVSLFSVIIFWGCNFFISYIKNGPIPLSLSLQSITHFITSTWNITTGQYILLFLLSKMMIYALIAMIFLFITLKSKRIVAIYMKTILLIAFSFLLYLTIPDNSMFIYLKYINIIPYVFVNPIYQTYMNLNIGGFPVEIMYIFWTITCIFLFFFIAVNIYIFANNKTSDTLSSRIIDKRRKRKINVSIARHECYKLFIMQRGSIVLFIFLLSVSWYLIDSRQNTSIDEHYYQSYMEVLQGPYTQEKQQIVRKEYNRIESLHKKQTKAADDYRLKILSENEKNALDRYISSQLLSERAFDRVMNRVNYANLHKNYPIVYETGYLELFGKSYTAYKTDYILCLFLILCMIFLFVPFLTNEYTCGMISLIRVQKNAIQHVFKIKFIICMVIATICTVFVYTLQFLMIMQQYNLTNMFAINLAIPELVGISIHVPLILHIILLYAIRLIMTYAVVILIFLLSQYKKNTNATLSILCSILVIPLILSLFKINVINQISLNSLLTGNLLLNELPFIPLLSILLCIIVLLLFAKQKKRNLFK